MPISLVYLNYTITPSNPHEVNSAYEDLYTQLHTQMHTFLAQEEGIKFVQECYINFFNTSHRIKQENHSVPVDALSINMFGTNFIQII
jgi:hypothetical protein